MACCSRNAYASSDQGADQSSAGRAHDISLRNTDFRNTSLTVNGATHPPVQSNVPVQARAASCASPATGG
jgi:hypothetical protein